MEWQHKLLLLLVSVASLGTSSLFSLGLALVLKVHWNQGRRQRYIHSWKSSCPFFSLFPFPLVKRALLLSVKYFYFLRWMYSFLNGSRKWLRITRKETKRENKAVDLKKYLHYILLHNTHGISYNSIPILEIKIQWEKLKIIRKIQACNLKFPCFRNTSISGCLLEPLHCVWSLGSINKALDIVPCP